MNILDYLAWRGDLSFSQSPFNEVDSLILSVVSYISYDDDIPLYPNKEKKKYIDCVDELFTKKPKNEINMGLLLPNEIVGVGDACAHSKRFSEIKVSNYIDKISVEDEEQFCALTFHIEDSIVVVFRGTDDTLIGWQENLNMICEKTIPAQIDSALYLNKVAELYPNKKIYLAGHSKGGNLATYASIYCDEKVQDRIVKVYSFDGPGFFKKHLDQEKYLKIKKRIVTYLPQSSIVGQFFDLVSRSKVVTSNAKGFNQHNALSWQVLGTKFVYAKNVTQKSIDIDKGITTLLESLSIEEKQDLSKEVWRFFSTLQFDKLVQIKGNYRQLIASTKTIDRKYRKFIISVILVFVKNGAI